MATQSLPDDMNTNDENKDIPTVRDLKLLAHGVYSEILKSTLIAEGFGKLKRKVLKELQHLETLDINTRYSSSNIHYLNSIWQTVCNEGRNVCSIFKKYKYMSSNNRKSELIVDIVCDDGLRWIKVKTSNPYSMQLQFINYGSSSKNKNIVSMATNFVNASNQHKVYFQPPKIQFVFIEGITSDIAYILKHKSIEIIGKQINDNFLYANDSEISDEREQSENEKEEDEKNNNTEMLDETCVNLGVRTMLTMISSLSNGDINVNFFNDLESSLTEMDKLYELYENDNKNNKLNKKEINEIINNKLLNKYNLNFEYSDFPIELLNNKNKNMKITNNKLDINGYTYGYKNNKNNKIKIKNGKKRKKFCLKSYEEKKMLLQMYIDELESPVLPTINKYIKNKKLICCVAAWNHFMDIVNLSAGKNEWKRCIELQNKITIVENNISQRTQLLNGKSMSFINKCVFGTGDSLKIITLTAIASFVRKSIQQGVKYFVHIHPVRPLTERYQNEYKNEYIKKNNNNDHDNNIINNNINDSDKSDNDSNDDNHIIGNINGIDHILDELADDVNQEILGLKQENNNDDDNKINNESLINDNNYQCDENLFLVD